jgi:hypothetical protein
MSLTSPQKKLLQEQEQPPQEDGRVSKIVQKITAWLNKQVANQLGTFLLQLANEGNEQLIDWLKTQTPQAKQELSVVVADLAIKTAYEQIAGQAGEEAMVEESVLREKISDFFSASGLAQKAAGMAVSALFSKVKDQLEQSQTHQRIVQQVAKYVSSYLTLGNIPDELAAKSQLLQSYDLPDKMVQSLGPNSAKRVMKILTVLGARRDLVDTMKAIINQYR